MSFEYAEPVARIRRQARRWAMLRELAAWGCFAVAFVACFAAAGWFLQ